MWIIFFAFCFVVFVQIDKCKMNREMNEWIVKCHLFCHKIANVMFVPIRWKYKSSMIPFLRNQKNSKFPFLFNYISSTNPDPPLDHLAIPGPRMSHIHVLLLRSLLGFPSRMKYNLIGRNWRTKSRRPTTTSVPPSSAAIPLLFSKDSFLNGFKLKWKN